jgi:predicted nucleic acid-binding protein
VTWILVDVNVILDVLLDRRPHSTASAAIWALSETGAVEGLVAAHAVTTIYYLSHRALGAARARQIVRAVTRVFGIASVDGPVLQEALGLPCPDFEDAVTAAAAKLAGCDVIVTRDPKGFRGAPVRALTPEEAAPLLPRR